MNPYRAPIATHDNQQPGLLSGVVSVFCFGWAFGTATRAELDGFGWFGMAVFILGILLWNNSRAQSGG